MTTTIFSWGYYGWGNHTPELIAAVDAIEKSRGFEPPMFVDIRIRRSVRAAGFNGTNFENLLGKSRHRWMKSLGNERIISREGPAIQISKPAAVEALLDLAQLEAIENRRLIYFCGCPWPCWEGEIACHRAVVSNLLLETALKRGITIQVVEWPGGEPRQVNLYLDSALFTAFSKGRRTIPLPDHLAPPEMLGLPNCSIATLNCDGQSFHRIVGPAMWQKGQWCLPIIQVHAEHVGSISFYRKRADKLRRDIGLNLASSGVYSSGK